MGRNSDFTIYIAHPIWHSKQWRKLGEITSFNALVTTKRTSLGFCLLKIAPRPHCRPWWAVYLSVLVHPNAFPSYVGMTAMPD